MGVVGNPGISPESVDAIVSVGAEEAQSDSDPSEDSSDDEAHRRKKEGPAAPKDRGILLAAGVPVAVEKKLEELMAPHGVKRVEIVLEQSAGRGEYTLRRDLDQSYYQGPVDEKTLTEYSMHMFGTPDGASFDDLEDFGDRAPERRYGFGEFETLEAAERCRAALAGKMLYGSRLELEVQPPRERMYERMREAWGRYWNPQAQEALMGPVMMKVKMLKPIEQRTSRTMAVVVRSIKGASGQYVVCIADTVRSLLTCFGAQQQVRRVMCSHSTSGRRLDARFRCKSGQPWTPSEAYRLPLATMVTLSGEDPTSKYVSDEEEDAESLQTLALKATDLAGERLLHVLAAVHGEAPKRVVTSEVAGVAKSIKGMPLDLICALKPHVRAKLLQAHGAGLGGRRVIAGVDALLRYSASAEDAAARDVREEREGPSLPRVVVRGLPMPVPLRLFKALRVLGVTELKMRTEDDLEKYVDDVQAKAAERLTVHHGREDAATLKLVSPQAARAALGQLKFRGAPLLLEEGHAFADGGPPLPDNETAALKDPRIVSAHRLGAPPRKRGDDGPPQAERADCIFLQAHTLRLQTMASSHEVQNRKGVNHLLPPKLRVQLQSWHFREQQSSKKEQARAKQDLIIAQHDQDGKRRGALTALTKRQLMLAFRTWQVLGSQRRVHHRWERLVRGCWYLEEHTHPWARLPEMLRSMRLPGGGANVLREAAWALADRAEWRTLVEVWGSSALGGRPGDDLVGLQLPREPLEVLRGDERWWAELRTRMELRAVLEVGGEPMDALASFCGRLVREQSEQLRRFNKQQQDDMAQLKDAQSAERNNLNLEQDAKRKLIAQQLEAKRFDEEAYALLKGRLQELHAQQLARRRILSDDADEMLERHASRAERRRRQFMELQREWLLAQQRQFLLVLQAAAADHSDARQSGGAGGAGGGAVVGGGGGGGGGDDDDIGSGSYTGSAGESGDEGGPGRPKRPTSKRDAWGETFDLNVKSEPTGLGAYYVGLGKWLGKRRDKVVEVAEEAPKGVGRAVEGAQVDVAVRLREEGLVRDLQSEETPVRHRALETLEGVTPPAARVKLVEAINSRITSLDRLLVAPDGAPTPHSPRAARAKALLLQTRFIQSAGEIERLQRLIATLSLGEGEEVVDLEGKGKQARQEDQANARPEATRRDVVSTGSHFGAAPG